MKVSFDAINTAFNPKLSLDERGPILVRLIEACAAQLAPAFPEFSADQPLSISDEVKLFRFVAEHVESDAVASYLLDRIDEKEAALAALASTEQPPAEEAAEPVLDAETEAVAEHMRKMFEK